MKQKNTNTHSNHQVVIKTVRLVKVSVQCATDIQTYIDVQSYRIEEFSLALNLGVLQKAELQLTG